MGALEIVQAQVAAYNARDLERFVALYSADIRVFRPPAVEPALVGKKAFAAFYAEQRFNKPGLYAEILSRMVLGNTVIDHERILGIAEQPLEIAVVYEIRDGLISTVWAFAKT